MQWARPLHIPRLSHVKCQISHFKSHITHFKSQMSHVAFAISHSACGIKHFAFQISKFIFQSSIFKFKFSNFSFETNQIANFNLAFQILDDIFHISNTKCQITRFLFFRRPPYAGFAIIQRRGSFQTRRPRYAGEKPAYAGGRVSLAARRWRRLRYTTLRWWSAAGARMRLRIAH